MRVPIRLDGLVRRRRERPGGAVSGGASLHLDRVREEVEAGLREIDYGEVTLQDRVTFVECAVAWQVRRAQRGGRFDLAIQLHRFGAERIAELCERAHGWRRGA